jgi:hypothetical protein
LVEKPRHGACSYQHTYSSIYFLVHNYFEIVCFCLFILLIFTSFFSGSTRQF